MKIKNISQENFTLPSNLIKDSTGTFHRDLVLTPGQIVYLETTLRPNAFIVWARKKYIEITDDPKPAAVEYCKAYSTLKSAQIKTTIVDMDDDDVDDDDSGIEEIPMAIAEVPTLDETEDETNEISSDVDTEDESEDDDNDDATNDLQTEPVVVKNKGGRPKGVKNKKKKKNKKNKSKKTKTVQSDSDLPSANPSDSVN